LEIFILDLSGIEFSSLRENVAFERFFLVFYGEKT